MSRRSLLATLFSSRGRPRASAAAPPFSSPAMLLPLLLVPGLLLPTVAAIVRAARADALAAPSSGVHDLGADLSPSGFPQGFAPEVSRWAPLIMRWSHDFGLPADVIATVMQIESCGDPTAHSSAGAQGLFQVMPFHFAPGEQPNEPEINAQRGLRYLSRSMELAGEDLAAGFAGYNGGHGVIAWSPRDWPDETRRYVRWATGMLSEVRAGSLPSPTLQAWLSAGGDYLCRQAASATVPTGAGAASG